MSRSHMYRCTFYSYYLFFFFNDPATTEIYTLSLHDALPISFPGWRSSFCGKPHNQRGRRHGRREATFSFVVKDRKSTRLNSSHVAISYAVFCLKKKKKKNKRI